MTNLNPAVVKAIIDAHTDLSSAAMRLANAYQAALTSTGLQLPALTPVQPEIRTTVVEAPKPAPVKSERKPAPRRPSSRRPAQPAAQGGVSLKPGDAVTVNGRPAKFFRLWRGSDGAFASVDFLDGELGRAKVATADIRLAGDQAEAVPAGNGHTDPAPAETAKPDPTPAVPGFVETSPGKGNSAEELAQTMGMEDLTETAKCKACADTGTNTKGGFCVCATGKDLQKQAAAEAKAKPKGVNVLKTVHSALLLLQPSKEKPATANMVAEQAGLTVADVFGAMVALGKTGLITMNPQARVIGVSDAGNWDEPAPAAPAKKGVAAAAAATLASLEDGGE